MPGFAIRKSFPVSRERMWSIFADFGVSSTPSTKIELESQGDAERGHIGAIRRIYIGRDVYREKLTEYQPGKSLSYQLLEGAPVDDYSGTIEIDGDDRQSSVTWRVRFRPRFPVPAWMVEKNAAGVINGILNELHGIVSNSD